LPTAYVNGIDLYYESDGDGPPLVNLHGGLGFDHQYMRRSFARLAGSLRVISFDQRCNGRSSAPVETLTMEQLADDVAGLLDHLHIEKATILGHSYGGFVAQEFALRHPARLSRLVLVDTTPGQLGVGEVEEQGPPMPPEMAAVMSRPPASDAEMQSQLPQILPFYLHSGSPTAAAALFEGTVCRVAAMARGFEVLAGWSSVDRLHHVSAPTLALWGRHDVVCSPPQAKRIVSRIPGAELRMFEQSGHMPWIDEAGPFFDALEDWLDRTPA
jgi:proline iminopeptidase